MSFHKNLRGKDLHAPSSELVEWNQAGTGTKLKVVTLDGMGTIYPQVRLNNASADFPFGVIQEDIPQGKAGYITCLGFMFEVDTSAWPVGTILYSDLNGNLTSASQGAEVCEVVKQDAQYGIIYVLALGSFISSPGGSTFWATNGNVGLLPSNFMGTTDAIPLKFRTNNLPVGQFDINGHFAVGAHNPEAPLHIKSYPGYGGTGLQIDTFAVTSDTVVSTPIYGITMQNQQVLKIKLTVTARQSDGQARASFTRTALFYKEGGNVALEGAAWQSDFTSKSNNAFDVNFNLGVNTIQFNVNNANPVDTYWAGHIEMEYVAGAT